MLAVAFWISFVLATLTVVSAIVKAALEVESDNAAKAETMSFVRMTLTGIFGVTIGQSLVPLGFAWWITAVLSVVLMLTLLVTSQLAARKFGHLGFGRRLLSAVEPGVRSLHLLFTPLSLPKEDEPEEFEQELIA